VRSLRGRIALALACFGLATLVAVGATLFVVLRDLYRDQATATLAELAIPYGAQVQRRVGPGRPDQEPLDALAEIREQVRATGLLAYVVGPAGQALELGDGTPSLAALPIALPHERGPIVRGTAELEGIGPVVYAAAPLVGSRVGPGGGASLVLVRRDTASSQALGDLLRALAIAAVVLVVIGVPLAVWLSRSVARPLGRLAAATGVVARGDIPVVLPTDGPSEVAEATAAFNAMAAEVARGREAQRQLIADVRHDLRTPLTVIGGFAEALRDGTARGPDAGRAADAIADEAGRLERMLGDLGALADLERGGRPLEHDVLDGARVVREAADRFRAAASARGRAVSVDVASAPLPLVGDRVAVDRILANLVANAISHARAQLWLEAKPVAPTDPPVGGSGGWSGRPGVVLAVRDDGGGIPPDALPRIFDRFYRADPSRSGPGSGLGLAIVAELAVAQGGRAFAESRPGAGARVGVVLPAPAPAA
jgi:signal transduction histidine kinase